MIRDELAARLLVAMVEAAECWPQYVGEPLGELETNGLARHAFALADAFEAERKRRLTEPEGK